MPGYCRRLLVSTAILLAFASAPPPFARADSLEDAVADALSRHPAVEGALAQRDAAKQDRREQFSGYFPEVHAGAAAGRIYGDNATSRGLSVTRGAGYSGYGEGSVSLDQKIFDGFEVINRVDAAAARLKSAASSILDVRESLGFRTAQAYLDVLRTRAVLDLAYAHKTKTDDYISRIKNKVDEGASDKAELQQAQDIKHLLGNIVADYEGQHLSALARYEEATGRLPEGEMPVPTPPSAMIPAEQGEALDFAAANHPVLKAADYSAEASGYDIDAETAALYPDLGAEMSYTKRDQRDLIGGESVDARALLRMNWNFSTGGAQFARIDKKRAEQAQMMSRKQELLRQIDRDIQIAYAEMETAGKQLDLNASREKVQEGLLDTYKAQFEGGKITQLQLLQAENQLFNAKLEQINSQYRQLTAQYGALASMGRLQESLSVPPVPDDTDDEKTGLLGFITGR